MIGDIQSLVRELLDEQDGQAVLPARVREQTAR